MKPWFVFYGTNVAVVRAEDEDQAYEHFIAEQFPERKSRFEHESYPSRARTMPPTRNEVAIRRPRESDRAWIETADNKQFRRALNESTREGAGRS